MLISSCEHPLCLHPELTRKTQRQNGQPMNRQCTWLLHSVLVYKDLYKPERDSWQVEFPVSCFSFFVLDSLFFKLLVLSIVSAHELKSTSRNQPTYSDITFCISPRWRYTTSLICKAYTILQNSSYTTLKPAAWALVQLVHWSWNSPQTLGYPHGPSLT